uniref:Uncharacterized protein n=1 Tax=Arundo donax TaxID=35708 RepID=A0A0A9FR71_ARUDO
MPSRSAFSALDSSQSKLFTRMPVASGIRASCCSRTFPTSLSRSCMVSGMSSARTGGTPAKFSSASPMSLDEDGAARQRSGTWRYTARSPAADG